MLGRKKVLDQQITTENIHKHRKAILRNGRKFKFPVQYLQHRVIINTIIIGFLAILIVAGVGGWQLYFMKNTGDVLYGITRVLPLSVAKIDKWSVKYSDYLMLYRSSIAVIERQEGKLQETAENAERLKMYKRLALDTAEENALTMGLAKDMGVSVARDEIEAHLVRQRSSAGVEISEDSFAKIIRDNYGLSLPEYKRIFVELPLLRSKLAAKVDVLANQNVAVALAAIREGKSFSEIAEASDGEIILETSGGEVSNMNLDGGRAERAFEMEVGQVSESFVSRSGDAFFIVKTIKKDEDKVEYESLRMPLTVLMNKFLQVKNEGQVREYIEL